ncbi:MAG: M23 family metallopeptidase [Chloroflexi bacterium]|nr:MAG: M23 family metallopeptidase [Chloroflexota bacterium]
MSSAFIGAQGASQESTLRSEATRLGPRRRFRRVGTAAVAATVLALAVAGTTSAYWPVASRSSYVSQWYSSHHRGIDLAAASGTHIVPARSGRVVFAGWKSNCGGYQVWVYHGNGLYTAYYHMRKVYARRGQYVTAQRTTIGLVGRSGCASGYHTHVERWHGSPWRSGSYRVNPWTLIDYGYYFPSRYR